MAQIDNEPFVPRSIERQNTRIITQTIDVEERGRVSWGAVFAGALVAVMTMLVVQLIFLWLGLFAIDPIGDVRPFDGVGVGAAITTTIATILALFAGGWVTGRLANKQKKEESYLHGILTWGVVTLGSIVFVTTAVGAILSGAMGALGQGLSVVTQGAAAVAPTIQQQLQETLESEGLTMGRIQSEFEEVFGNDPVQAQQAMVAVRPTVGRILQERPETVSSADREQLVAAIVSNTELTTTESVSTVDRWIETYEDARAQLAQLEGELRAAADQTAAALAKTAFWSVVALLIGALIATVGAALGAPLKRKDLA